MAPDFICRCGHPGGAHSLVTGQCDGAVVAGRLEPCECHRPLGRSESFSWQGWLGAIQATTFSEAIERRFHAVEAKEPNPRLNPWTWGVKKTDTPTPKWWQTWRPEP